MKNTFILLLFPILMFWGCKNEPTPPEEFPEGYQQDIPWPSLADSPWPMFQGSPQGTNRSEHLGPVQGVLEWVNEDFTLTGGFSIGILNDLYAASAHPAGIFRLDILTGKLLWHFDSLFNKIIDVHPCPIIASNNMVIATTGNNGKLISLTNEGRIKWSYDAGSPIYNRGITISKDYLILFIDRSNTLNAIDTNGQAVWKVKDMRFGYFGHETPVFSPDGNILYFQGVNIGLIAFNLKSKEVLWTFGNETSLNYPLVDSQGHIYVLTPYTNQNKKPSLYSLNQDGTVRWIFEHNNRMLGESITSLSINKYGDIYFSGGEQLYCVDYYGNLKFTKDIGTPVPIIIDSKNDLYLLSTKKEAIKLDKDGEIIWKLSNLSYVLPGYSCISNNQQWIISDYQYNSYIISLK